ncbi:hypothetical protein GQ53DRAFT_366887 [Thozetella sp. PMI_491]|nr:hypothetical protein GQ53DRAFT_366887 [Thozetella sp. PMI_491]
MARRLPSSWGIGPIGAVRSTCSLLGRSEGQPDRLCASKALVLRSQQGRPGIFLGLRVDRPISRVRIAARARYCHFDLTDANTSHQVRCSAPAGAFFVA